MRSSRLRAAPLALYFYFCLVPGKMISCAAMPEKLMDCCNRARPALVVIIRRFIYKYQNKGGRVQRNYFGAEAPDRGVVTREMRSRNEKAPHVEA